jgi:hypothetical protein
VKWQGLFAKLEFPIVLDLFLHCKSGELGPWSRGPEPQWQPTGPPWTNDYGDGRGSPELGGLSLWCMGLFAVVWKRRRRSSGASPWVPLGGAVASLGWQRGPTMVMG